MMLLDDDGSLCLTRVTDGSVVIVNNGQYRLIVAKGIVSCHYPREVHINKPPNVHAQNPPAMVKSGVVKAFGGSPT